jgi:hypothetical protein
MKANVRLYGYAYTTVAVPLLSSSERRRIDGLTLLFIRLDHQRKNINRPLLLLRTSLSAITLC